MNFPVYMYRAHTGEAVLMHSEAFLKSLKDAALYQLTPWKAEDHPKRCEKCEALTELNVVLKSELAAKDTELDELRRLSKIQSARLDVQKLKR